jgi:hypothetical protein
MLLNEYLGRWKRCLWTVLLPYGLHFSGTRVICPDAVQAPGAQAKAYPFPTR